MATPMLLLDPIDEFARAMSAAGLAPPDEIVADGSLHRFALDRRDRKKSGWYVLHLDGRPAGKFGSMRDSIEESWSASAQARSPAAELERRINKAKKAREDASRRAHKAAAERAQKIWEAARDVDEHEHEYLRKKCVRSYGLRVTGDGTLIIPMIDAAGQISSVQFIAADGTGTKKYLAGGKVRGTRYVIGEIHGGGGTIAIVEGYATGAAVYEATGYTTVVAFSAGGLRGAAEGVRKQYPRARIIIAGDHDASGVGQRAATEVAQAVGGMVAIPTGEGDWNDVMRRAGMDAVSEGIHAAAHVAPNPDSAGPPQAASRPQGGAGMSSLPIATAAALLAGPAPRPIDYVIGGLPAGELGVLSGSDGAGKSMLALQMAVAVACGLPVAGGAIPAPEATGRVVIISGEDDIDHIHRRLRTLRAAIAAEPGACGREAVQRYDAGMDRLDLVALDGERMPLMRAGRQDDEPRECAEATDALVQACTGARLIIIDPLVMFHSIAEGDNGHMDHLARLLIRIARRIGGALLAVHHTGQDALLTARDDHQAGRGATAFASAARAVWVLRRLSQQERRAAEAERRNPLALRILRGPKVSRGPEQDGVLMEMGQDGVLFLASPLSSGGGRRLEGKRQWDAAAYAIASGRGPDACPF